MEALFTCEYIVDRQKYLFWAKEADRQPLFRGIAVFWYVFSALIAAAAIYTQLYGLFLLTLFTLYRGLLRRRILAERQYSIRSKQYGTANWSRKISFCESTIVVSEESLTVTLPCSDLKALEEQEKYIRLLMKNKFVIYVYSDCFVRGTWEECREYLLPFLQNNNA